jgi:hypothetical protein
MKKLTFTTLVFIFLLSNAHAQKPSETEARQYLEKVWGYLKTSDSIAFINLWLPEDSVWQKLHTPIDGINLAKSFNFLEEWLFPAIISDAAMEGITVGQKDARGTEISAMFKTRLHGDMGFSFHIIKIRDKWSARGEPHFISGMSR